MSNTISVPAANLKDWLGFEQHRNKRNAELYSTLLKAALKRAGQDDVQVLIGHHITFELGSDLNTENEIPSADCLIFDHYLMKLVFGEQAVPIMQQLASVPCSQRDVLLGGYLISIGEIF